MNCRRRVLFLTLVFSLVSSLVLAAVQAGVTQKVFNRKFTKKLKGAMSYEEVTRVAGAPGRKVADDKSGQRYHWDGGKGSVLDITVVGGKLTQAAVHTKRRSYKLGSGGKMEEVD